MSAFPDTRLRRLRRTGALRSLVRETRLDLDDFVKPLFVGPTRARTPELPPMGRFSVDDLSREVEELVALGVSAVILFGIPEEKDEEGSARGTTTESCSAPFASCGRASRSSCCSPTSASASTRRTATAA